MKQRQSFGGGMGLLILVMLLIMLFSTRNQSMFMPGKISYPEFMMNVENGSISSAVIKPNRETPTGEVDVYKRQIQSWKSIKGYGKRIIL